MKVVVDFAGGFEQYCKSVEIDVKGNLQDLIREIRLNHIQTDIFANNMGILVPGILCLVNDTDWELLDGYNYVLEDQDKITFISTLHGG